MHVARLHCDQSFDDKIFLGDPFSRWYTLSLLIKVTRLCDTLI
jgi:hypothetical protein